ncbi:phosphocholine cytidylyltransferase family protein [Nitratidesulfovibrio sp. HK-II]|uniref:phosphocholine cytidylyltransferase family protein n=1 Tax=Nitratidesulfovibrio sp. HK-II TaxID=2009266 RepID=UPI000E2F571A|nr:phosphocholine cytidylyltransferase family protein [Nitratidesulfovibrio sp. HK-II]
MGELTSARPKCMTGLAGRPLLHWQLDSLRQAGLTEIHVVTGYLGDTLKGPFATFPNARWQETNMVASLACAASVLSRRACIVAYSDIVYHPGHVRGLAEAEGDIVITSDRLWEALWRLRFDSPLDDAETFRAEEGLLAEIGAKPRTLDEIQGQYMGLLKITPRGWEGIRAVLDGLPAPQRDRLDMTSLLRLLLQAGQPVGVVSVEGRWLEVDSGRDVLAYERALEDALAQGTCFSHDWRENPSWCSGS